SEATEPPWPFRVARALPVATSQRTTVLSVLPVATSLPSGLTATHLTSFCCDTIVPRSLRPSTSQRLTLSCKPEINVLPLAVNPSDDTPSFSSVSSATALRRATSHKKTLLGSAFEPAAASILPPGANASAVTTLPYFMSNVAASLLACTS